MEINHETEVSAGEPDFILVDKESEQLTPSVDLCVRNLSISIVPQPSYVVTSARSIKKKLRKVWTRTVCKQPHLLIHSDEIAENSDRDLTHVGLNILRNVSLNVKAGQGAGKTTLLNALAGRMKWSQIEMAGRITFNGIKAKKYWKSTSVGFLHQNDYLEPYLSARETLEFVSKLHKGTSRVTPEMTRKIDHLLTTLGLKDCADRLIGLPEGGGSGSTEGAGESHSSKNKKGISGGERRRVSIAMQLLTDPAVLFCDEPTSGLDSFASFEVMKTLISLAKTQQKTIVCSIHQPRSEIFELLAENNGQLVLLSLGDVVYSGPIADAIDWLQGPAGMAPCHTNLNQFDYLIDLSGIDYSSEMQERLSRERRQQLVSVWASKGSQLTANKEHSVISNSHKSEEQTTKIPMDRSSRFGIWTAIQRTTAHTIVLTRRGMVAQSRDRWWLAYIIFSIVMALWMGGVFWNLSDSIFGTRARRSLLVIISCAHPLMYMIVLVYRMSKEVRVFDRERKDGWWLQYVDVFGEIFKVLVSIEFTDRIFDCPFEDFMGGRDEEKCRWYNGNDLLEMNGGNPRHYYPGPILYVLLYGIAYIILCWLILIIKVVEPSAPADANTAIEVIFSNLASLFFTEDSATLERKRRQNEKNNLRVCNSVNENATVDPHSSPQDAPQIDWINGAAIQQEQQQISSQPPLERKEMTRIHIYGQGLTRCDRVEIRVDRVSLTATTRQRVWMTRRHCGSEMGNEGNTKWRKSLFRLWQTVEHTSTLLKDIEVTFPSGELTAILGTSGAGKTSLLCVLLDRTPANLKVQGDVWFNGTRNPSLRQVNTVCGYVRQDDSFLPTHLTVRETLMYAAELSMGRHLTKMEKSDKVEAIMELMGLLDCADVLIGSSETTGCSGGQRRRVSIALQLIIEPACLVLDEPTTGLDAMSALAIMHTLKAIARTGRTVICTIHQPRSAIWDELDNVVLLMADFAIDSTSINFESEASELAARQRINTLACKFEEYKALQQKQTLKDQQDITPGVTLATDATMIEEDGVSQTLSELTTRASHFAPWTFAIPILVRRMFWNMFRQRALFVNRVCLGFIVGTISALMFVRMDRTMVGLLFRVGYFHQFMNISVSGVIAVVSQYPNDKRLAFHEVSNGLYSASSFLASYIINEIPHGLLASVLVTGCHVFSHLKSILQSNAKSIRVVKQYFHLGDWHQRAQYCRVL
ncbi:hypothetical protein BGW41_004287 [Actinomortierella wolfii]|nr:hypothetical protein BGW41_004287 [Actinomortierella wolfii]